VTDERKKPTMVRTAIASPDDNSGGKKYRSISAHERFDAQHSSTSELPDPAVFLRNFTQRAVEALMGRRELGQLARWVTDDVMAQMNKDVAARVRKESALPSEVRAAQPIPVTLPRLRYSQPRDGIIEASVLVSMGTFYRVAAVRLEGLDRRWRASCFALL